MTRTRVKLSLPIDQLDALLWEAAGPGADEATVERIRAALLLTAGGFMPATSRVPSVVFGTNADVIERIAPLIWPDNGDDLHTLDLTYGRGLWWTKFRPPLLTMNDRDTGSFETGVETADFRHLEPERVTRWRTDSGPISRVTYDPPYVATGGRETTTLATSGADLWDRFDMDSTEPTPWEQHVNVVAPGLRQAALIVEPGGLVLVKCQDYVTGGKVQRATEWLARTAEDAGLVFWDKVIHASGLGPQPARPQQHIHRAHSELWIWQKPERRKPRARKPKATPA